MKDAKKGGVEVSVIIPCYNGAETIGEQLEALTKQTFQGSWEVLVADNGSSDSTITIVSTFEGILPRLKIVDAKKIKGPAYARNRGVDAAIGDLLLFADADDVVAPDWMELMVKSLHKYEIVAPKMEHQDLCSNKFSELKSGWQVTGLVKNKIKPSLYHAGTSGLGVRRSLHEKINGFDENLIACEDWDYCWKAQLAGAEMHFESNAVIHIRHPKNIRALVQQSMLWGEYYKLLLKKYEHLDLPKKSLNEFILEWKILLDRFRRIRNRKIRFSLLWAISYKLGKLKGSIRSLIYY